MKKIFSGLVFIGIFLGIFVAFVIAQDDSVEECSKNIFVKNTEYSNEQIEFYGDCAVYRYTDAVVSFYDLDGEQVKSIWRVIDGKGVEISGEIGSYTGISYQELQKIPHKKVFLLKDIPGSFDDEVVKDVILNIHRSGYATSIMDNGRVSSGGTDFFTAGVKRSIGSNVHIGVHSWMDADGKDARSYPKDDSVHDMYINMYTELGISEDFYWFTLDKANGDDMYWMTEEEIKQYLLTE